MKKIIRRVGKILTIIALINFLLLTQMSMSYAQASTAVVGGFVPSQGFFNAARAFVQPVLLKAGPVSRFAAGAFTPASIAVLLGGVVIDIYREDPHSFPRLRTAMAELGIGASGKDYVFTMHNAVIPVEGGNIENCLSMFFNWWSSGSGRTDIIGHFTSYASASASKNVLFSAVGPCVGAPSGSTQGAPGGAMPVEVYNACRNASVNLGYYFYENTAYSYSGKQCPIVGQTASYWYWDVLSPGEYTIGDFISVISPVTVSQRLTDALMNGTGDILDKTRDATVEMFRWLNGLLATNSPLLDITRSGLGNKTIREVVNEKGREATGAQAPADVEDEADNYAPPGSDTTTETKEGKQADDIIRSETDPPAGTTETSTPGDIFAPPPQGWSPDDFQGIVPEPFPPDPDYPELVDDNDDFLDGIDDDVEAEKTQYRGIMGQLKLFGQTIADQINSQLQQILPNGGSGLCSISAGGTFPVELSLCDFDFSAIRGLIISIGALVSIFILLGN